MTTGSSRRAARATWLAITACLVATPVSGASEFREVLVRLDHAIDAAPIDIRLADGAGLVAVGQTDEGWRFSVVSLTQGGVVTGGVIPETAFFYDTGDLAGQSHDRLCFLDEAGVACVGEQPERIERIARFSSLYHGDAVQGPTFSDFIRDVDGDGHDDILAPQFDGWLLARRSDAGFAQFVLGVAPRVSIYDSRVSYQPREPRIGDVNGDGFNDVVFLIDTEFLSFVQAPPGSFTGSGRRDRIDAPLASEKQRARWERDDGQVDQSDLEIEEVELVRDFNDDDVPDLFTEKSISEGVFDRRSEYHLYLGRRVGDTLEYASAADGTIASGGVQFDPLVVDVDGDGRLDVATPSTRLGLARIVSALFSGRITVDLDIYRMRADGHYPEASDYRTRFKVEFDLETGLMRYPAVVIADFNGDGAAELLVQEDEDELHLYPGGDPEKLFGKRERTLSMPLPRNGQMVEARDLDEDGRSDLLVRYGPADGEDRFGELRILLSTGAARAGD